MPKGREMTGAPIDDALTEMPDFEPEYLTYLKMVRARLQVYGWLDTGDVSPLRGSSEELKTLQHFVRMISSELIHLISFDDERMTFLHESKLARYAQMLAEEINGLRRGAPSEALKPLPIRQTASNSLQARQLRQVLGSSLVILSGPKRGKSQGGDVRSAPQNNIMTRKAAMDFILDVMAENGLIKDFDWLRAEFKKYYAGRDADEHRYVDPPSRLSLLFAKQSRSSNWTDEQTKLLVRKELQWGVSLYLEAEERGER